MKVSEKLVEIGSVIVLIAIGAIAIGAALTPAILAYLLTWRCLLAYPLMLTFILLWVCMVGRERGS